MRPAFHRLSLVLLATLAASGAALAALAGSTTPAVVHKPSVEVRAAPDFGSPALARLKRDASVGISAQQGLWYQLDLGDGRSGYVRVNEVRMVPATTGAQGSSAPALLGRAGRGRVTETATVRGIDAGDFARGRHDAAGLERMERHRVDAATAAGHAAAQGWQARSVPWAGEAADLDASGQQATQEEKRSGLSSARGLLSKLGGGGLLGDTRVARVADRAVGKSDREVAEEERALGPAVTGRVLGVAPLWNDDRAQRRVNLVGRWLASQTSRPGLPWTFGVIDDGELNAYAAPGGYVLLTRGLYELLDGDAELAAVLAHELGHVVQRDHFEVIRREQVREAGKDAALSQVSAPGAAAYARDYADRHGAAVLLSGLDRDAEYRADHAAGVYLERAGFDPLAFYSVLQKLASLGSRPAGLEQLYRTHPPLDQRLDRLDAGMQRTRGRRR